MKFVVLEEQFFMTAIQFHSTTVKFHIYELQIDSLSGRNFRGKFECQHLRVKLQM